MDTWLSGLLLCALVSASPVNSEFKLIVAEKCKIDLSFPSLRNFLFETLIAFESSSCKGMAVGSCLFCSLHIDLSTRSLSRSF